MIIHFFKLFAATISYLFPLRLLFLYSLPFLFISCAGQTVLVPYNGRVIPVFRNSGNLKGPVSFSYKGNGINIMFSSGDIDNAVATKSIHDGIQGEINQAGSLIFKTAATIATGSVLGQAAGAVKTFSP